MTKQQENKKRLEDAIEAQRLEKEKNLRAMLFRKEITQEEFDRKIVTCTK